MNNGLHKLQFQCIVLQTMNRKISEIYIQLSGKNLFSGVVEVWLLPIKREFTVLQLNTPNPMNDFSIRIYSWYGILKCKPAKGIFLLC